MRATPLNQSMKAASLVVLVGWFEKNISSLFTIIHIAWSNQIMDPLHPVFALGLHMHLMYGLCTFQSSDRGDSEFREERMGSITVARVTIRVFGNATSGDMLQCILVCRFQSKFEFYA